MLSPVVAVVSLESAPLFMCHLCFFSSFLVDRDSDHTDGSNTLVNSTTASVPEGENFLPNVEP